MKPTAFQRTADETDRLKFFSFDEYKHFHKKENISEKAR